MNVIPIATPNGCEVVGELVESLDYGDLSQDMVEVMTPTGVLIDAGWVPEWSPSGRYLISVSRGMEDLASMQTTDVHLAAEIIASYAKIHSSAVQLESNSASQTTGPVPVLKWLRNATANVIYPYARAAC